MAVNQFKEKITTKEKLKFMLWKLLHWSKYKRFKKLLKQDINAISIRPGIKFGYYGSKGNQVSDTKDHINLFWEFQWKPIDQVVKNIRDANMDTVLDLSHQLFAVYNEDYNWRLDAESENRVRALLTTLRNEGVLHLVKILYPLDEPNLKEHRVTKETLRDAVAICRKMISEFKELAGAKLGVIYYGRGEIFGTEYFDIIGLDDYRMSAESLFLPDVGVYAKKIMSKLSSNQKVWIVPGGYVHQSVKEFVNWAASQDRVYAIIPFMWDCKNHPDSELANTGGIKHNGMADEYRAAGKLVIGKQ